MNCYFASAVARRQRIEEEKSVSLQMRDYVLTAKATGFTDAALLPVREKKKEKREVHLTVFVMEREDGAAALRQRPDTGLLAGLWEYPHAEGTLDEAAAAAQLAAWGTEVGILPSPMAPSTLRMSPSCTRLCSTMSS